MGKQNTKGLINEVVREIQTGAMLKCGETMKTKFKCVICGKVTAGRISREGRFVGDTSARFPRRHKNNSTGKSCSGNIIEAKWINE